jgi:hypothetical protein
MLCKNKLEAINRARCAVNLIVPLLQYTLASGYRTTKTGKLFSKDEKSLYSTIYEYSTIYDAFKDSRVDLTVSASPTLYLSVKSGYLKSSHSIEYINICTPVVEPDGSAINFEPETVLSESEYHNHIALRKRLRARIQELEKEYRATSELIHDFN